MKNVKKLISYVLIGCFSAIIGCIYLSSTAGEGVAGTTVNFGLCTYNKEGNSTTCQFKDLEVSSSSTIKTIQIKSGAGCTVSVPDDTKGFTECDDTKNIDNDKLFTSTSGASAAEVQAFLRNVKYSAGNSSSVEILLSNDNLLENNGNAVHYFPENGHFYQNVNFDNPDTNDHYGFWVSAYNAAQGMAFHGWNGYLANITSANENAFCYKYINDPPFQQPSAATSDRPAMRCIGGTRAGYENINTASITPSDRSKDDVVSWYWAGGPEYTSGTGSDGKTTHLSIFQNYYVNWGPGEPWNGVQNNQGYAWAGMRCIDGKWGGNHGRVYVGYIVEYGGHPNDNGASLTGVDTFTGQIKPVTLTLDPNYPSSLAGTETSKTYTLDYNAKLSDVFPDGLPELSLGEDDTSGYEFKGWYTEENYSQGIKVDKDTAISTLIPGFPNTQTANLYAQWWGDETSPTINGPTFVTVDSNGKEQDYDNSKPTGKNIRLTYTVEDKNNFAPDLVAGIDIDNYHILYKESPDDSDWKDYKVNGPNRPSWLKVNDVTDGKIQFTISRKGTTEIKISVVDLKGNPNESSPIKLTVTPIPSLIHSICNKYTYGVPFYASV